MDDKTCLRFQAAIRAFAPLQEESGAHGAAGVVGGRVRPHFVVQERSQLLDLRVAKASPLVRRHLLLVQLKDLVQVETLVRGLVVPTVRKRLGFRILNDKIIKGQLLIRDQGCMVALRNDDDEEQQQDHTETVQLHEHPFAVVALQMALDDYRCARQLVLDSVWAD